MKVTGCPRVRHGIRRRSRRMPRGLRGANGGGERARARVGRFRRLQRLDGTNLIVVIEEKATGKLVASGTLAIELKFVHSCGQVGHIEDIVCDESYRGKQLGRR